MRAVKVLPLLSFLALLPSCNLLSQVKSPIFTTQGEEVKFAEFNRVFNESIVGKEIDPDYQEIYDDKIVKTTQSDMSSRIYKIDGKEVSKDEGKNITKTEEQYDYRSLVSKKVGESESSYNATNTEGTNSDKQSTKIEMYYQFGYSGGAESLLAVNNKTKQYTQYYSYNPNEDEKTVFNNLLKNSLNYAYSAFVAQCPTTMTAANGYRFFINNDEIFTFSYEKEQKGRATSITGENYAETLTKTKLKYQIEIANGKQAMRISNEVEVTTTVNKDGNGYKKGDVIIETSNYYEERTYKTKDVSLKAVDVSNYREAAYL